MVIEADMVMCSSYGWATTRDWSKFDCCTCTKETGMGADSRGEFEICRNPTATSEGAYGAQFWLNAGGKFQMRQGMFYCRVFKDRW
jgi:hypothetical protein